MSDPDEKELVKQEISKRYYQHYLDIINKPVDQPESASPPAPEEGTPSPAVESAEEEEPATEPAPAPEEKPGQPATSPSLEEQLAGIPEVTPIRLKLPAQEAAVKPEEKKGPEKTGLRKFCFIATAAYGSPLAREVLLLQDFRDRYLSRHALGEKFIQAYYRLSPTLAEQISKSRTLKLLTRSLLTPVIFLIKKRSG